MVNANFVQGHTRRGVLCELVRGQGDWAIASEIDESHVSEDVNESSLIQSAYKQHEL